MTWQRGRREKILELKRRGLPQCDIAREVGCSNANVCQTLARHHHQTFKIAALPPDKTEWLVHEARKSRVSPAEMARAMLLDAIAEATGENCARRLGEVKELMMARTPI